MSGSYAIIPPPGPPVDHTVRCAAKPSCVVMHRVGEETYAPTVRHATRRGGVTPPGCLARPPRRSHRPVRGKTIVRGYAPRGRGDLRPYAGHMPRRGGVAPPGHPVANTVRFAPEPSCAVTHRMGEETYAPTSVMRHVGAGLPRPVAALASPFGSRQTHRTSPRTAGARKPTPLHPSCVT